MKFICSRCGEINKAVIDGYGIGDRLLEGVWFDIIIQDNQLIVTVDIESKEYFDQFNKELWYKKVKEEVHNGYAECPNCHEEIILRD